MIDSSGSSIPMTVICVHGNAGDERCLLKFIENPAALHLSFSTTGLSRSFFNQLADIQHKTVKWIDLNESTMRLNDLDFIFKMKNLTDLSISKNKKTTNLPFVVDVLKKMKTLKNFGYYALNSLPLIQKKL